eukprot:1158999-Pelagomonas_calceolata.AAC.1
MSHISHRMPCLGTVYHGLNGASVLSSLFPLIDVGSAFTACAICLFSPNWSPPPPFKEGSDLLKCDKDPRPPY